MNYGSTTGNPGYRKALRLRKRLEAEQYLWEIAITQGKTFYVVAPTQEDALEDDAAVNERLGIGDFDFEHIETTATKIDAEHADFIRKHHPEQIAEGND